MKTGIIAEDKHILVCFKPSGLAVQSGRVGEQDMVSELKNYLAAACGAGGKTPYLGLIHRLDQPVSGLLVFAKTPEAAAELSAQAAKEDAGSGKGMEKEYRACVYLEEEGLLPAEGQEILTDYLVRDGRQNLSRVASVKEKGAKRAQLSFKVLKQGDFSGGERHALLGVRLYTGRHHQIRVQLAHAGLPLLGDARYGSPACMEYSAQKGIRSICLCAWRLGFTHPATGKRMYYELEELPWSI